MPPPTLVFDMSIDYRSTVPFDKMDGMNHYNSMPHNLNNNQNVLSFFSQDVTVAFGQQLVESDLANTRPVNNHQLNQNRVPAAISPPKKPKIKRQKLPGTGPGKVQRKPRKIKPIDPNKKPIK